MVVLLITFVVLLVIGMPVAFVIGLAGVAFFASAPEIPFSIAVQRIVAQTQSYTFLAVPFFIFAGNLMNESGITKRILDFASMLTRRMYGGLAQVSVVMSTMMGGISGSATADAAMETPHAWPFDARKGIQQGLYHGGQLSDWPHHGHHSALSGSDYLWICRRGFHWSSVCGGHHSGHFDDVHADAYRQPDRTA